MMRKLVTLGVVATIAAGGWYYQTRTTLATPEIRTATVTRGSVVATVAATGTTQAVTAVTVGSQVSGTVSWLGADFNSVVRRGQVIAKLDPSLLNAQVEQAKANLTKANADRQQRVISQTDKETKLARVQKLSALQLVSATELGDAQLAVDVARTDMLAADAQVSQAEASLNQARLNLSHATITAPIDGTVIERSVDIGQTVAASLSSPTLFVIAADLREMRATLSIDESDISQIVEGQPVTITVSAYPGERFRGEVAQVRLQPVVASNVTSYTTIVDITNPDLKLKPGMTANAQIEIGRRDDVLRVPNTALRFAPTADQLAAIGQATPETSVAASTAGSTQPAETTTLNGARVMLASATTSSRSPRATSQASGSRGKPGQVWAIEEDSLKAIHVRLGLSDGTYTEVLTDVTDSADVNLAGMTVVTSMVAGTSSPAATSSPAVSTLFSGGGSGMRGNGPR